MESKRIKLLVAAVGGVLVMSVGVWLAVAKLGLGQKGKIDKKVVAVVNSKVDSDEDGLTDEEEKELGTNMYNADSDDDGYSDGEEIKMGFDPLRIQSDDKIDLDQDGLIGSDEEKYGTDPRLADSDFDGYNDGEEIASGHDPLTANLSDFVAINALANANKDDLLSGGDSGGDADSDGEEQSQAGENVVEVSQKDKQQVDYLEQAFSAQDVQSFQNNMVNYVESQSDVETIAGQVQLPEITNDDIRIAADASDERVRHYIANISDIFYNSFSFREQKSSFDLLSNEGFGSSLVYQFTAAVTSSLEQVQGLEVPKDDKIIDVHKEIVASLVQAEYLAEQIAKMSNAVDGNQDDVIKIMNSYSELTYLLKSQVVDNQLNTLDQIAEEKGLKTKT